MSLSGLLPLIAADPAIAEAMQGVTGAGLVVPPAATAPTIAALASGVEGRSCPVLAVTATTREADDLSEALASLLDPSTVGVFPSWETLPHERLSPRSDTVGRRIAVLRRLAHPDPSDPGAGPLQVLVAPVRALLQPFALGLGDIEPVRLQVGDDIDVSSTVERLVEGGYTRTDMVERRGEFAVRGGILDVFPAVEEHPLRVELWGDTVEEIRWFKAADQRSLEAAPHWVWAPPTRELPLTEDVRSRAGHRAPWSGRCTGADG
jgi:transcription-repair coupling factor (superfamily II helicase)